MIIDINERERKAMQLFKEGHNCAQSVALAFSDVIQIKQGMTEDQIRAVMSGFGGGIGRLREVCGTVSGMTFVAGAVCPAPATAGGHGMQEKARNYDLVQELAGRFRQENGSIICRELLDLRAKAVEAKQLAAMQSTAPTPSERTPEYYKARPCEQLVGIAARILAARLNEME